MTEIIRAIKVPVEIDEKDDKIRQIKSKALEKAMAEARYLGNLAIRYAIARDLRQIPNEMDADTGQVVHPETWLTRVITGERKYLQYGCVATLVRNFALRLYRRASKDALVGKKGLPTCRSLFLPFRHERSFIYEADHQASPQFTLEPGGFSYVWLPDDLVAELSDGTPLHLSQKEKKLRLISRLSKKDHGAIEILRRISAGEYHFCDSQIQKKGKNLMAVLSYRFEPKKHELDVRRVCGVDLGIVTPAVCATNIGPHPLYLGSGAEVWAARSRFRALRRRKQKTLGLYSKTHNWEQSDRESNWTRTYYHGLTRQVIKFCVEHGCGKVHIEDLSTLREVECKTEYKRLLWVPSMFQRMLSDKAEEAGIKIVKVNPRNSSRRCSECGHISKENRVSQKDFVCCKCGDPHRPIHADYNAAKNLALATGKVIRGGYCVARKADH